MEINVQVVVSVDVCDIIITFGKVEVELTKEHAKKLKELLEASIEKCERELQLRRLQRDLLRRRVQQKQEKSFP